VSTAQWRQVDLQTQLQTTRLDAEGADRRCFGIEQSIFAAPHTPRIQLLFGDWLPGFSLRTAAKKSGRVHPISFCRERTLTPNSAAPSLRMYGKVAAYGGNSELPSIDANGKNACDEHDLLPVRSIQNQRHGQN
jgi:hypothetical protein